MPPNEDAALDPRDYLVVIRRRKWVIVATVVVAVGVVLAVSLVQTPRYTAKAEVLVRGDAAPTFGGDGGGDPERDIQNELELLQSDAVVAAVRDELGFAPDVSIGASDESDLLVVTATSTGAERAATMANTYAEVYLVQRQAAALEVYDLTTASIEEELATVRAELSLRQTDLANETLAQGGLAPNAAALQQQLLLQAQIDQLNGRVGELQDALGQIRLDRGLAGAGRAEISQRAEVPTSPSSPRTLRNALIALVLGLVLGLGLAFLVELLDRSVKSKDDLESVTGGLTVLGLIPHVTEPADQAQADVLSRAEPTSRAAEAYRSLRVALQFSTLDRAITVLMVSSATSSEGKTTTAANLAVAAARAGQRVVVVDADLRRPRLHELFGLPVAPGLTSVVLGDDLDDSLRLVHGVDGLQVLTAGPPPPDPAEVLGSKAVAAIVDQLREQADLVIVDTPPVVPVADALAVSLHVDATLLVACSGTSSKREIARAVELLQQVQAPVVGTVLNDVDADAGYRYGYGLAERDG